MKKTLFATISILLMLFAFVACDGGSQGPTGGDVTESEAKTLAGNYLGSINFSQLIVDAFDNEVKGVSVESATANGFVITLKDYSGDAFKETTIKIPASKAATADSATDTDDTESSEEEGESIKISKIAAGSIEFTFTTADSKTTYTARTLEKTPIVFEGAPEGADLAFEISGPASVSFSKLSGGIITGFESKSTVKISAPTTSEISVGGASVDYDDIKESAKGGFDQTVTIPVADEEEGGETGGETGSNTDAKNAIADIINALDRAKIAGDIKSALTSIGSESETQSKLSVTSANVYYEGGTEPYCTFTEFMAALESASNQTQSLDEKKTAALLSALAQNPDKISIAYVLTLTNYTHGLKSEELVESISGTVNLTIQFGKAVGESIQAGTILGTYTLSTKDLNVAMKGSRGADYEVTIDALPGQVSLTLADKSIDFTAPNEEEEATITIVEGQTSSQVKWSEIATDEYLPDTAYSDKLAKQLDAEYFYQHFGTLRFLKALYSAFENNGAADTTTFKGFKLKDSDNISIDDSTKSFSLNISFADYVYNTGDGNQKVTGDVTFTFTGTAGTDAEAGIFKVTSFKVKSSGDLKLADTLGKRPAATTSLDKEGFFGRGQTQASDSNFISFIASDGKITGIKQYIDETPSGDNTNQIEYVQGTHEFVIKDGIESIKINLAKTN